MLKQNGTDRSLDNDRCVVGVYQYLLFVTVMPQSEAGVKNRKFFDLAQLVQQYAQRGDKNGLACSLLHPVNVDDDEIGRYFDFC